MLLLKQYQKMFMLLIVLLFPLPLRAQVKLNENFSKLPEKTQKALFQRIDSFFEKRKNGKWGEAYDDFWQEYINGVNGLNGMTKDAYIKAHLTPDTSSWLVGFSPFSVRLASGENEGIVVVMVYGCGEYQEVEKNKNVTRKLSSVSAVLVNNQWYFASFGRSESCVDCPKDFCK